MTTSFSDPEGHYFRNRMTVVDPDQIAELAGND